MPRTTRGEVNPHPRRLSSDVALVGQPTRQAASDGGDEPRRRRGGQRPTPPGETKREAFYRVAKTRMVQVVKSLTNLHSLCNPDTYDFTDEDIEDLLASLKFHVSQVEEALKNRGKAGGGLVFRGERDR